jgi:hypothetical protein
MQELIERIINSTDIDQKTAEQAIGSMLGFLKAEGDEGLIAQLFATLPGADLAAQSANYEQGIMGGIMGLGSQLMGLGLDMADMTSLAKQTIDFAREKSGSDIIDAIISAIPGMSQFS